MGLTAKQKLVVKGIGSCTGDESMLNYEHILVFNNILCDNVRFITSRTIMLLVQRA